MNQAALYMTVRAIEHDDESLMGGRLLDERGSQLFCILLHLYLQRLHDGR